MGFCQSLINPLFQPMVTNWTHMVQRNALNEINKSGNDNFWETYIYSKVDELTDHSSNDKS